MQEQEENQKNMAVLPRKPTYTQNFNNVPAELKSINQWVLWNYEQKVKGGFTKVLKQSTSSNAMATNAKTWTTYENALQAFTGGNFDGLGFILTKNDPYVVVDLDHVGEWIDSADEIINSFDSYTENSPSGDGVHIWIKAKKPELMGCKSNKFHNSNAEVYEHSRFMTMTGNGNGQIVDGQTALEHEFKSLIKQPPTPLKQITAAPVNTGNVDITEIQNRLIAANKTHTLDLLSNGQQGDNSADDLSVCNDLAWATGGNPQLIDAIIRESAMYRGKWERSDYRERTINLAISDCKKFWTPPKRQQQQMIPVQQNEVEELAHKDVDLIDIIGDNIISNFASELALSAKMPRNTTFLSVMSIVSSIACRVKKVEYNYGGGYQPLSINVCLEQPPSAAKSWVLKASQKPVFDSIQAERKALNKRKMQIKNELGLAPTKEQVKSFEPELAEIHSKLNGLFEFITDTTAEALDTALNDSDGYYAIASAEQGAINSLLGASYTDKGSPANRDIALKGFNGEWHNAKRKGRETYMGYVVGSITAIAQDGMIENLLKSSDTSGVFERFIAWSEKSNLGTRDFTKTHAINNEIETAYSNMLSRMQKNITGESVEDLESLIISKEMWYEIALRRNELEPTIADGGENSTTVVRGIAGKYDIYVMKIASLLHLGTNSLFVGIDDKTVRKAMAIVDAYIVHINQLVSTSSVTALSDREQAIMKFIGHSEKAGTVISTKLYKRKCFTIGGSYSRDAVKDTMKLLIQRGLVSIINHVEASSFNNSIFKAT